MFGKLMKHELRATARIIPLCWAAAAVITGLYLLVQKLDIVWLKSASVVFVVIAVIAVSIVAVAVVAIRFSQTMFGSESYLSHSLPVPSGKLLLSKALVGVLWIFCSVLITLGGLLLILYPWYEALHELQSIVDMVLAWVRQVGFVPVVLGCIGLGLLSSMESVAHIFTAITLGNLPGNQKHALAFSVVFYLLINQVLSTVYGVLILLLPPALRFSPEGVSLVLSVPIRTLMDTAQMGAVYFDYGITGIVIQYAADIALLFLVKRLLDKKLSVK